MRLIYTEIAQRDIRAIGHHIRQHNPLRAASLVRGILACCRELQSFPDAFPLYPREGNLIMRRRVFGQYLIFYTVTQSTVTIVRVLHGARNLPELLFRED